MAGGEMEKSSAGANHQLPEVDSLPDGFVDSSSSAETPLPFSPVSPSSPQTPNATTTTTTTITITTFEQQKRHSTQPSVDYKEDKLSDELQQDLSSSADKTEKHRTFPVPLSDRQEDQCFNSSSSSSKVNVVPESSMMITTQSESQPEPTMDQHEHEHLCPISTGGCPELDVTNPLEKSTSECAEILKTKKLETSEVKRKNVKRSFKSEKEFLEFTLKYQQVIAERDSAAVVRDKLESLCRELQRQNKLLMDECKRVSTEGQNMRLDLSTRFHDAIKDVSQRLEGQKDECLTQLKENDMLRNKLKHLADQYATSEHQFTQKLKQKTLQLQLADLKIQQHEEKLTQEQAQVKLYAEQVSQLLATEHTLRLQLAADGEKFQQFQDALIKSNEVFETFKQEIEKMAKSIKELKKENAFLKGKCERSDVTLIELVEEREQWKKQLEKIKNQKEKLESLCRSLQAERRQTSADNRDSVPFQSKAISSEQVS